MACSRFNSKLIRDNVCSLSESVAENININFNKYTEKDKFNKNLIEKTNLFLNSKDINDKNKYKKNIESMFDNSLFDKNNSKLFNRIWKNNSNYFLDYNEKILNPVVKHVFETNDNSLIEMFLKNGLNYVDKFTLCLNPSFHSHSAIILKFNKPIKFDDSNSDVAGILYSFSIKTRTNNSKITFWNKLIRKLKQLISLFWGQKAYMTRILLTSDDFSKMEKVNGNDVFKLSSVDGALVKNSVNLSFDSLKILNKFAENKDDLKSLTSDIEKISYFFSLYTKNSINYLAKDKIINYSFSGDSVSLKIGYSNNGRSIYDFIQTDCKKLNLTHTKKMSIIKEFLKLECLKLLKENRIIKKDATNFSIDDFDKLPKVTPNDLKRKFCYTDTLTFDLNRDLENNSIIPDVDVAKLGYRIISGLEKFNLEPEEYSFLRNNCITTLKRVISDCGTQYKKLIKNANKELNIFEVRYPLSVFHKLKKLKLSKSMNNNFAKNL